MSTLTLIRFGELVMDYLLIIGAFVLAYFFRVGSLVSTDFPFAPYLQIALPIGIFWIGILFFVRSYRLEEPKFSLMHLARVIFSAIVAVCAFVLFFFFTRKLFFSRLLIVYLVVFGTLLTYLDHLWFSFIQRQLFKRGIGVKRTLVIGTNRKAQNLIQKLQEIHSRHLVVAILDGYGSKLKEIASIPVLGKLDALERTIQKEKIEQIIQVDNLEQTLNIITFCEQHRLGYFLLPALLGAYQSNLQVEMIENTPVIRTQKKGRRWFDYFIA